MENINSAMKLKFTKNETDIIWECIRFATLAQPYPDWEFSILFGFERKEYKAVWNKRYFDFTNEIYYKNLIRNAISNAIGYPHHCNHLLNIKLDDCTQDINKIIDKL